jgi:hypothetical protein
MSQEVEHLVGGLTEYITTLQQVNI